METNRGNTAEIRRVAQEVTGQQEEICAERSLRNDDQMRALARVTAENTAAIAKLVEAVITLTSTVSQLAAATTIQASTLSTHSTKLADHDTRLAVIPLKTSLAAIAGGSLPPIIQWLYGMLYHH